MIRVYAIIGLVAFLAMGGAYWKYSNAIDRAEYAENALAIANKAKEDADKLNIKTNAALVEANVRASKYSDDLQVVSNEKAERDKCIADKSCGFIVRTKYIEVPAGTSLHAGTSEPRADETACQFNESFQRTLSGLRASIENDAKQIIALQREADARSKPDYCKVQ